MNHTINICLIPSSEIYDTCLELNSLDTNTNYNLNSRDYIPHATLVMKTLSNIQIQEIAEKLSCLSLEKQVSKNLGYYAREVAPGDLWTGITVEKTHSLHELQKQVLHVTKQYEAQVRTPETYAIDDFYEQKEILFFQEEEYLVRDELHITLGKQDIEKEYNDTDILPEITFDKLVIGKIGNYGSVREILFEIDLK